MLAKALVFPHFYYCSSVWSNCTSNLHNTLQVLQNRLARVLLSADIRTSVNKMMKELDWVKPHSRWNLNILIHVFKCINHIAPDYISSGFAFTRSSHSKCTRSQTQNALIIPSWNIIAGKRTFQYRGAKLWNNIPSHIRCNFDLMSLKELL